MMKFIAIVATVGLVLATPSSALTLRGRQLADLGSYDGTLYSTTRTGDFTITRDGFNGFGKHTFGFSDTVDDLEALNVAAPGQNMLSAGNGCGSTIINNKLECTNVGACPDASQCNLHTTVGNALARLECKQTALSGDADYLEICGRDQNYYHQAVAAVEGVNERDSACHDALCIEHSNDVLNIPSLVFEQDNVCEEKDDQEFLTILDCALQHTESLTDNSFLNATECNVDGTNTMAQAIYNMHWTLQEKVLFKVWEHAKAECAALADNRDTDFSEYEAAVQEAAAAQDLLSNMILQYDDFHRKVGDAVDTRISHVDDFIADLNAMKNELSSKISTIQDQLHTEIDHFLKDAKASASNYRTDLNVYFENFATKRAHVIDMHEKVFETNRQILEHTEDLQDLDTTLTGLLNTIKDHLEQADEHIDSVVEEGKEVLETGATDRDVNRASTDQDATQPVAVKSCENGKIVSLDCDCHDPYQACIWEEAVFSSNSHREQCNSTDITNGNTTCPDDPETDSMLQQDYVVDYDDDEILIQGAGTDTENTAYDMYADGSNDDSVIDHQAGGDTTDDYADPDSWNGGSGGVCGLCAA